MHNSERERFIIFAMQHIGIPYIWGGEDPKYGLDCSGLVQRLLAFIHIDPPGDQTAHDLFLHAKRGGRRLDVGEFDLGDLCFYGKPERATHISMCINKTLVIEAAGGGRNTITPKIARATGACVQVRPYNAHSDFIGAYRLKGIPWHT